MSRKTEVFDELKNILEHIRTPEALNTHPWLESLLVKKNLEDNPSLAEQPAGYRLFHLLAELFQETLPATPPKRTKRLDTRWGRFGILAANYFAPFLFGRIYPDSLRDAWRRIDTAILDFVFGQNHTPTAEERQTYLFVGDELDMPANSTISDWHRDGLKGLAELLLNREKHLSLESNQDSPLLEEKNSDTILPQESVPPAPPAAPKYRRIALGVSLLLLVGFVLAGIKARQLYPLATALKEDIAAIQSINPNKLDEASLDEMGNMLEKTQKDLAAMQAELAPYTWLTNNMGWFPVYGADIQHADELLGMAESLINAVDIAYETAMPIWASFNNEDADIGATELTAQLLDAHPSLLRAEEHLQTAKDLRSEIDTQALSPYSQNLLVRVDPYIALLDQALSTSLALPKLLGSEDDGPQTYLILIQNEDELRPTGGFISAVGKVVIYNGEMVSWEVKDSYDVDDPDAEYFAAPWQLDQFMNLSVFVFRDSNWITDYPVATKWAEYLYMLKYSHSVDGIFAIDQHVLVKLLTLTGPIYISELDKTINAKNVLDTMREEKTPPPDAEYGWYNENRKNFMKPIAASVLNKLLSGEGISWKKALNMGISLLNERHILMQLDDPALAQILADRNWDGAVRYAKGDFLMLVDANVGYNKVNAVISREYSYDISLQDIHAPEANLSVFYHNNAEGKPGEKCEQPTGLRYREVTSWYRINGCLYNYLRLYLPAGTTMLDATPHAVTRDEMVYLEADVPPRVDEIEWEQVKNVDIFGTLFIVPIAETLSTSFHYALPESILQEGTAGNELVYHLKIQKQAGIEAVPVTIRVHLPKGAQIRSASHDGIAEGDNLLFDLELREDIELEIVFSP